MSRTALLINCSEEELSVLRNRAARDRRPLSQYVLFIVMRCVWHEEKLARQLTHYRQMNLSVARRAVRPPGPRSTFLVRCTPEEAFRIRAVATARDMTISGFVLHSLALAWSVQDRIEKTHPPRQP
jgi:hypothetical protein